MAFCVFLIVRRACIAGSSVHANDAAASRARPPLLLLLQKHIHTRRFNGFLILLNICKIFCSVALVESFEPCAHVIIANVAKVSGFAFTLIAASYHAALAGVWQIVIAATTAALILIAHVRIAQRAVYTARRNHNRIHNGLIIGCHIGYPPYPFSLS
jgi:hypothetical protein